VRICDVITIREATKNDKTAVARIHVRSWQVAYRGLIADEFLDQMDVEDRAARYTFGSGDASSTTAVATEDGNLRGFVMFGPSREVDAPETREIFALYVDPDFWRQGIGKALMARGCARLRAQSMSKALLWVLEGNVLGARFYESQGWALDGSRRQDIVWGVNVNELRFARSLED